MYSTFFGLELAQRALSTYQAALDVTGHNISNANTAGYTRQLANIQASTPLSIQASGKELTLGTGSTMDNVVRARDYYIDRQFRWETSKNEYWSAKQDSLTMIEGLMNEPSEYSLHDDMDQFWNAWSELAKNPENMGARSVVRERAMTLVDTFHNINQQITDLQNDLDASVAVTVKQINTIADQIKELNTQIKRAEVGLDNPNDLKDQRDALVDELSKIVPVRVVETQDPGFSDRSVGIYKVIIGNDTDPNNVLVNDQTVRHLEDPPPSIDGFNRVVWADVSGSAVKAGNAVGTPITINDGDTLKLNIDGNSYVVDLSPIKGTYDGTAGKTMNDLAANLATQINAVSSEADVTVAYNGGHLEITSGSAGAGSLIDFEAITGSAGRIFNDPAALSAKAGNTGTATVTVTGTYSGDGNTLTAAYSAATKAVATAGSALSGIIDFSAAGSSISLNVDGGGAAALDLTTLVNNVAGSANNGSAVYNLSDSAERTELVNDLQALIDAQPGLNGKLTVGVDANNKLVLTSTATNSGTASTLAISGIAGSGSALGLTAATTTGVNSGWKITDNDTPPNTGIISGDNGSNATAVAGLTITISAAASLADGDSFAIDLTRPDSMTKLGFDTEVAGKWVDLGTDMGKLQANIEIRDDYLEGFRYQMDTLAQGIASAVNSLHNTGQGLKIEANGIDFFTGGSSSAITAANITVNSIIMNDLDRIATGSKSNTISVGDGSVALAIAAISQGWGSISTQIANNIFGTNGAKPVNAASFGDYYSAAIAQMGVDVQQSERMSEGQSVLVNHMTNLRESSSGVSLDEEMVNLVKFQKSYSAAARIVTMLDSMYEKILGMGVTR
ncbi:MAG: Flagellar hook-associated protein 1 [Candidatus Dichloromethanomonas elyunquensis]|nr:MAG: Flagellar hook-associated protein 1 [Candidatus Dichloromethanomonas elyunquensis]